MATLLLLDTSVYIHGRDFTELAWNDAVSRAAVEIVVPLELVRELDRIKDQDRQRRIRERARHVLQLMETRDVPDGVEIRPGVRFRMLPFPPGEAYLREKLLDPASPDEKILGAAMRAAEGGPSGTDLVVISRDTTQRIIARRVGLEVFALPSEFMLKEEDDPIEKELIEVKRQLVVATDKRVELTFSFATDANYVKLTPFEMARPARTSLEELLEQANTTAPSFASMGLPVASSKRRGLWVDGPVEYSQPAIDQYESQRAKYLSDVETYSNKWGEWEELLSRTFELNFLMANIGKVPADDASAALFISGVESVHSADTFPHLPAAPVAPSIHNWVINREPPSYNPKYRTRAEMQRNPLMPDMIHLFPDEARPHVSSRAHAGDFSVSWHMKKLQQGKELSCHAVYVTLTERKPLVIAATVSADAFGPVQSTLTLLPSEAG